MFQRARIIDSIHREGVVARNLSSGKACPGGLLQVQRPARGISVDLNHEGMGSGRENKAELESFLVYRVNRHRAVATGVDRVCPVRDDVHQIIEPWSSKFLHTTRDKPVSVSSHAGSNHTGALV